MPESFLEGQNLGECCKHVMLLDVHDPVPRIKIHHLIKPNCGTDLFTDLF